LIRICKKYFYGISQLAYKTQQNQGFTGEKKFTSGQQQGNINTTAGPQQAQQQGATAQQSGREGEVKGKVLGRSREEVGKERGRGLSLS